MYEFDNPLRNKPSPENYSRPSYSPPKVESSNLTGINQGYRDNYSGQALGLSNPIYTSNERITTELYKRDNLVVYERPILNKDTTRGYEKDPLHSPELRELEEMHSKVDSLLHNSQNYKDLSMTSPSIQPQAPMRVEDSFQPSEPPKTASEWDSSTYPFQSKYGSALLREDHKVYTAEIQSPEFLVSPIVHTTKDLTSNRRDYDIIHRSIEVNDRYPYTLSSLTSPLTQELYREKDFRMSPPDKTNFKKSAVLKHTGLYQDIKDVAQVFQTNNLSKLDQLVESIKKRSQGAGISYNPPIERLIERSNERPRETSLDKYSFHTTKTINIRSPLDSGRPLYDRHYSDAAATVKFLSPRPEVSNFQGERDFKPLDNPKRERERLTTEGPAHSTTLSRVSVFDSRDKLNPLRNSKVLNSHVPLKLKNDKTLPADQKDRIISFEEQEGVPQRYAIPDPTVKEKDKTHERNASHLQSRPIHMSEISSNNFTNQRAARPSRQVEEERYQKAARPSRQVEEEPYQKPRRVREDRPQANKQSRPIQQDRTYSPREEEYPVNSSKQPLRGSRPTRQLVHGREEQTKPINRAQPQPSRPVRQTNNENQRYYEQEVIEDDESSGEFDRVIEKDPEPHIPSKGAKPAKVNHVEEVRGGSSGLKGRRGGQKRTDGRETQKQGELVVKSGQSSTEKAPRRNSKTNNRSQSRAKTGVERLFDRETELDDFVFE